MGWFKWFEEKSLYFFEGFEKGGEVPLNFREDFRSLPYKYARVPKIATI
jgi:hypothetical protein